MENGDRKAVVLTQEQLEKITKETAEAGIDPKDLRIIDLANAGDESGLRTIQNLQPQTPKGPSSGK